MEPPIHPLIQNQEKKVGVTDPNFAQKWLFFPENPQKSHHWENFFSNKSNRTKIPIFGMEPPISPLMKNLEKKWGPWTHVFRKNGLIFLDFGQDPKI